MQLNVAEQVAGLVAKGCKFKLLYGIDRRLNIDVSTTFGIAGVAPLLRCIFYIIWIYIYLQYFLVVKCEQNVIIYDM